MGRRKQFEETKTAEVVTVAWSVSVTAVLLCDLAAILAHMVARLFGGEGSLAAMATLVLFAGCVVGAVSLLLLPIVYRVRRLPPPPGFVVFAALVAAAPFVAILAMGLASSGP